jgi:hypothetical protein
MGRSATLTAYMRNLHTIPLAADSLSHRRWLFAGCGREAVPRLKSSLSPPGSVRAPMAKKYPLFGPATSFPIGKPTPIMPQSSTSAATPAHPCPHRRHTRRSGFKKFVRERAKARPKQRRWAHYDDGSGDNSQCPRCDKGQHRRCLRLTHCKANERSPAGINKRREERAKKRAIKAAVRRAKEAFHEGMESWMRRLRFDGGSGPGNGGGLGGGLGGGPGGSPLLAC